MHAEYPLHIALAKFHRLQTGLSAKPVNLAPTRAKCNYKVDVYLQRQVSLTLVALLKLYVVLRPHLKVPVHNVAAEQLSYFDH